MNSKQISKTINNAYLLILLQYPQIILPAAQKPVTLSNSGTSDTGSVSGTSLNAPSPAPSNASNNFIEQPPLRPLGKLEDMKGYYNFLFVLICSIVKNYFGKNIF